MPTTVAAQAMSIGLWASAGLFGLAAGPHCLTMCGGFVGAIAARDRQRQIIIPVRSAVAALRNQALYHVGRITTYALLGAAFGAAGALALGSDVLLPLQRTLYIIANAVLLLLAARLVVRVPGFAWLQQAGAGAFSLALPRMRPLLQGRGAKGQLALGLVWGLVPCASVYSVAPLALFAGNAGYGALVMMAFGLGTLPHLLAAGTILATVRRHVTAPWWRYVTAALLMTFGAFGLYRAVWVPGALAQGMFCQ